MSVTPTYPGLYIQEVPSNSHAIVPAPTSIAAFVGYSHPYKTKAFNRAVQLFSFSDYEASFGGLFASGITDPSLPRAVYEFFLNGGSNAWVYGLQPALYDNTLKVIAPLGAGGRSPVGTAWVDPATKLTAGIDFVALEPTDAVGMTISVINTRPGGTVFDLVVTYGSRVETYRGVTLPSGTAPGPDSINKGSALIRMVAPAAGWGATIANQQVAPLLDTSGGFSTGYSGADFLPAFAVNSDLDMVEIFNLLLVPGNADTSVMNAAMAFAEHKRAFAIVDPPPQAVAFGTAPPAPAPIDDWMTGNGVPALPRSQNAALYFPYLSSPDPVTGKITPVAPSGFVAGIYARTDADRGVWKAPAGLAALVKNTTGPVPSGVMNDPQQGVLNQDSINCLRSFSGIGTVVWGARTTVANNQAFAQSMYVPVRRMTLFIEQTLLANLRWVVFEPNDEPLWAAIRNSIEAFMLSLFRQGALQGSTPSQAFLVKCDASTTSATDQQNGIVNILVAFAPLKPAEFVIIQIAQLAGQTSN